MAQPELLVVVHGFAGKRIWMQPLSSKLRRQFRVINWSYFSLMGSIDSHARRFCQFLHRLDHAGPINIVAHSMGSIVVRSALAMRQVPNLNRVVLLAPPNSGSPIARVLDFWLGWACRPIRDLSSDKCSYVNEMSTDLPCETAVIAARFDILVPVSSTYMPRLSDHVTIRGTHNSLLFSPRAGRLIVQFLATGRFADR